MESDLATWESKADDVEWLMNNQPVVGVHGNIGAELAAYTEKVANKHGVSLSKRPSPQRADTEETGAYRSARAKVVANAMDGQLYKWLVELQDPELNRAITFLRISPQRDDPTRVDCELEVTQWFRPEIEEELCESLSDRMVYFFKKMIFRLNKQFTANPALSCLYSNQLFYA